MGFGGRRREQGGARLAGKAELGWVLVSDRSELSEAKVTDGAVRRKYAMQEMFGGLLEPRDCAHGNPIPPTAFHPQEGPLGGARGANAGAAASWKQEYANW